MKPGSTVRLNAELLGVVRGSLEPCHVEDRQHRRADAEEAGCECQPTAHLRSSRSGCSPPRIHGKAIRISERPVVTISFTSRPTERVTRVDSPIRRIAPTLVRSTGRSE